MDGAAGEETEWPFPGEHEECHDHVDDLEEGEGFYCVIEVLGQEVPEDFGPEESFEGGCALVWIWVLVRDTFF